MEFIKDDSCYNVNDLNPRKFYAGQIPRNPVQCKHNAYSLSCTQGLNADENGQIFIIFHNLQE